MLCSRLIRIRAGLIASLAVTACHEPTQPVDVEKRVVDVDNVEELYAAVGDPDHEDFEIRLSPGRYLLSSRAGDGSERPYGGALRLRTGMRLVGGERRRDADQNGILDPLDGGPDPAFAEPGTETVIDGSQIAPLVLPVRDCSGNGPSFADPVVQLAPHTALRGLTILGGPNLAVGEGAEPYRPGADLVVVVDNTVIQGGSLVMTFGNTGCAARSQQSRLTVTRSAFYGAAGSGLSIVNYQTGGGDEPIGPKVTATIERSLFLANGTGLVVRGGASGTRNGLVSLRLWHSGFEDNGSHLLVMGGFGNSPSAAASLNRVEMSVEDGYFGRYLGNRGIQLFGGRHPNPASLAPTGNAIDVSFRSTLFERGPEDQMAEIWAIGADGGNDNTARLALGDTWVESAGIPVRGMLSLQHRGGSAGASCFVRIGGDRSGFAAANPGFVPPPEEFFTDSR